jgi:glycosyltransferase involved in cell wall biosynthesis
MSTLTFIIPSIGRNTLQKSIESIQTQTVNNWKIIVIFDGIQPTIPNPDSNKIVFIKSKKKGIGVNSAGNVRNYGMNFVKSDWIAFLDDDDIISPKYVETFNSEIIKYPNTDVIIFRMKSNNKIMPSLETANFYKNYVGISFALKTEIFKKGNQFIPSSAEDFIYLKMLRNKNYNIMISPYIRYFVNPLDIDDYTEYNNNIIIGNRVILNDTLIESFVNRLDNGFTEYNNNNLILIIFLICIGAFVIANNKKSLYKRIRLYFI